MKVYVLTCIALLLLPFAYAQAGVSYTASPLIIDEEVVPRDIIEKKITLVNTGDAPVTIYPTVNNISLNEGGGIEAFIPQVMSDQTTSLAAWIEISRAGIDLRSGETKSVTLTLRINPGAKPGTYHALVGFPYGGNRDEAERMLARGDSPGTVVSVSLEDKRVSLLRLSRFIVDRFVTKPDNSAIHYKVSNPGDEPLSPGGEIIIYDGTGKEVGAVPVNPDRHIVQPGEEKEFVTSAPTDGLFGKYKAFLTVDYGTANIASVQDTAFFYALPLKVILTILGILIVVSVIASIYIHKRYFDEGLDDGSEFLPLHVKDSVSDPLHHDINLRS